MKAIVCTSYGPPKGLLLKDVDKPDPKDNEVLVQVRAVSINTADRYIMRGKPFLARLMSGSGFLKPKTNLILGADIAGRIVAIGKNVKQFEIGDDVFGDISEHGLGGLAEYACVNEEALALKPDTISYEQAAAVGMAAVTALQGFRGMGEIGPNHKVLIYGASGGVGTFAIQIAKSYGAQVTAVCSTRNVDLARSLGADQVVDYTQEDFTQNSERYDYILAANGYHFITKYMRSLKPKGVYVMSGGSMAQIFQAMLLGPFLSATGNRKVRNTMHKPNQQDLLIIKKLLETQQVKPFIDKLYPLTEAIEAFKYLEGGHAQGKIVLIV